MICDFHANGVQRQQTIFEIGLGRSASRSICEAFHLLGLNVMHGRSDCLLCRKDLLEKLCAGQCDWDLYKSYDYFGNTSALHWYQLYRNVPDARFVLPIRPIKKWLDGWEGKKHSHARRMKAVLEDKQESRLSFTIWNRFILFGMVGFNRKEWERRYKEHTDKVIETIEPSRLLVLDVWNMDDVELWKKVAGFIGQNPPDIPFPKLGLHSTAGKSERLATPSE